MSKKYIECEAAKEQIRAHIIIGEPKTNVGLNLAIEAIDEVPAADVVERPRWIPVEERLPEKSGNYLTVFEDGSAMAVNEFMHPRDWLTEEGHKANPNGKWYWGGVTHWMPLPEPPKEEEIRQYRKKPVVVEAVQLNTTNMPEVAAWIGGDTAKVVLETEEAWKLGKDVPGFSMTIHTLEGDMTAKSGDYIIKGVQGEFYPCKSDIFEKTYEAVEPPKEKKECSK